MLNRVGAAAQGSTSVGVSLMRLVEACNSDNWIPSQGVFGVSALISLID